MTHDDLFYTSVRHIQNEYKAVCEFNRDLHDDVRCLEEENAKLRHALAKEIHVQGILCADKDAWQCRECPLHREETDDCLACDAIGLAQELGIEEYE